MVHTFRIVLRQEDGFDKLDTREFDLALDSKCAIGRASKNMAKTYLSPAKHNMYIDSPVISREHAILTANTSTGAPQVFVTDTKSMHGTFVNDAALVPFAPKQLCNGDKLRFGVDVNRNESFFVAYNYTFKAELTDPEPFSRGFTVPDAESEEEELDFAHSGCGSRVDPLVLGASDDEQEGSFEADNDITLAHVIQIEDDDEDDEDDPHDEDEREAAEDDVFNMMDMSEDEDAADNIADDAVESDIEDHAYSTALPYSSASSSAQETQHVGEIEEWHLEELQETTTVQPPLDRSVLNPTLDFPQISEIPLPELPDFSPFGSSAFEPTVAPPLPPRPSQKRQRVEAPQEQYDWFNASQPVCVPSSLPVADGMQTPPHTVPAKVINPESPPLVFETNTSFSDVVDDQPPTPTSINNHKRSADEAFSDESEEVSEQSNTKSEPEAAILTSSKLDENLPEKVALRTVEQDVVLPQRRIAQPRGIFSKALHAAKIVVPATALGAVFTVTALTTLPESFFTVA